MVRITNRRTQAAILRILEDDGAGWLASIDFVLPPELPQSHTRFFQDGDNIVIEWLNSPRPAAPQLMTLDMAELESVRDANLAAQATAFEVDTPDIEATDAETLTEKNVVPNELLAKESAESKPPQDGAGNEEAGHEHEEARKEEAVDGYADQ